MCNQLDTLATIIFASIIEKAKTVKNILNKKAIAAAIFVASVVAPAL